MYRKSLSRRQISDLTGAAAGDRGLPPRARADTGPRPAKRARDCCPETRGHRAGGMPSAVQNAYDWYRQSAARSGTVSFNNLRVMSVKQGQQLRRHRLAPDQEADGRFTVLVQEQTY